VQTWGQPMIQPMQEGLCAFIAKKINGIIHFLVQAKIECGNFDVVEMAPTVQCLTGNYKDGYLYTPDFLDYVLDASEDMIILNTLQSEEGGRFFHEQNRYIIVKADSGFCVDVPENYQWLTLGQLKEFLRYNNYLNIQARSLLAALNYTKGINE
jgi:oxidase EvaA